MATSIENINVALEDILPFLDVLTPLSYKNEILQHLLGMTGTANGARAMAKNDNLSHRLVNLVLSDGSEQIRLDCLRIFVNITSCVSNDNLIKVFQETEFLKVILQFILEPQSECSELLAMLITNLTQSSENADAVFRVLEGTHFSVNCFVDAFCVLDFNKKKCSLHHIGSFLANLTLIRKVRLKLLDKEQNLLCRLLAFTQYKESLTRRLAVARIIKNCLFETDFHEWLLSDSIDILPSVLLPLAGPEEFTPDEYDQLPIDLQYLPSTKARESNEEIQILLCESLFQLCATKACRLQLKDSGTYYILREFHKTLQNESKVVLALENVIHVLIGDEPEAGKENLREVEIPEELKQRFDAIDKSSA